MISLLFWGAHKVGQRGTKWNGYDCNLTYCPSWRPVKCDKKIQLIFDSIKFELKQSISAVTVGRWLTSAASLCVGPRVTTSRGRCEFDGNMSRVAADMFRGGCLRVNDDLMIYRNNPLSQRFFFCVLCGFVSCVCYVFNFVCWINDAKRWLEQSRDRIRTTAQQWRVCLRSEAFQLIEFDWKWIEFFFFFGPGWETRWDRDAVLFHLGIFLTVATAKSNGRTIEPEAASVGGPFEWKSAAAAQRL